MAVIHVRLLLLFCLAPFYAIFQKAAACPGIRWRADSCVRIFSLRDVSIFSLSSAHMIKAPNQRNYRVQRYCRLFLGLVVASVFSGCVTHDYKAMSNGYGRVVTYIHLPDAGWHFSLTYTPNDGRRQTVWPYLFADSYPRGGYTNHEDLIAFVTVRPDYKLPEDVHNYDAAFGVFAAKAGPPAIDITPSAYRVAMRGFDHALPDDVQYYFSKMESTDTGVRVLFRRWLRRWPNGRDAFPEVLRASLTWQDVENLVLSSRTNGKPHSFRGTIYYAEE
jgi:hypothetical protein